jgi:hypothetical protein
MKHGFVRIRAIAWLVALAVIHPAAYSVGRPAATTLATTSLTASASTTLISGTLINSSTNQPLANAVVDVTAVDVTARTGLMWHTYTGSVPAGAASAVFGVRAGTEGGCICAGAGGITVGGLWYTVPSTGAYQDISPVSLPVSGAPDSVRTWPLVPGQTISTNLGQFPVTAGTAYAVYFAMAATGNAVNAGYVTLIFLDSRGAELRRDKYWFSPASQDLGTVTTNSNGQFSMSLPAAVAATYPEYHASYAGSSTTKAATAVIASTASASQAQMPALAQQLPTTTQLAGSKLSWFTPREDFLGAIVQGSTWDQLLPQWSSSAKHIQAIRIPTTVLLSIPDSVLPGLLRSLDAHGLALGLEIGAANNYNEVSCGAGVEGYSDPGTANQVVQKLLDAGGKLSALLMDEPLWYGHYYYGANACYSTIQDQARRAAVIVKIYTAAFPNVVVGDIEPFPALPLQSTWQADYTSWVQAFYAATGSKIAFLHADFDWTDPAMYHYTPYPSVAAMQYVAQLAAAEARANGMGIGFILNGSQGASSDAQYAYTVQFHIDTLAGSGTNPDQLAFETWDTYPTHTLPETDGTSLTSEIYYYFSKYN